MSERIIAVVGCGHVECGRYVMRGGELGKIVDTVALETSEVWQIEWPDGTVDLMSTVELGGVTAHRPPNRPPSPIPGAD